MGASAAEGADLPESVVAEMRRAAAELLGNVSAFADEGELSLGANRRRPLLDAEHSHL